VRYNREDESEEGRAKTSSNRHKSEIHTKDSLETNVEKRPEWEGEQRSGRRGRRRGEGSREREITREEGGMGVINKQRRQYTSAELDMKEEKGTHSLSVSHASKETPTARANWRGPVGWRGERKGEIRRRREGTRRGEERDTEGKARLAARVRGRRGIRRARAAGGGRKSERFSGRSETLGLKYAYLNYSRLDMGWRNEVSDGRKDGEGASAGAVDMKGERKEVR
jgi:hypothetical protein